MHTTNLRLHVIDRCTPCAAATLGRPVQVGAEVSYVTGVRDTHLRHEQRKRQILHEQNVAQIASNASHACMLTQTWVRACMRQPLTALWWQVQQHQPLYTALAAPAPTHQRRLT